jgi:hypothetical protein
MNFPVLERLALIQKRLASTLTELGVQARIVRTGRLQHIEFGDPDDTLLHLVSLAFPDGALKSRGQDWSGTKLRIADIVEDDIGDNGWKIKKYYDPSWQLIRSSDEEAALSQIEAALKSYPVVRVGNSREGVIDQMYVRECYVAIEREIRNLTDGPINCERIDGVLRLVFREDHTGNVWHIAFPGWDVVLQVNGKVMGRVASSSTDELWGLLFSTMRKLEVDTRGLDY